MIVSEPLLTGAQPQSLLNHPERRQGEPGGERRAGSGNTLDPSQVPQPGTRWTADALPWADLQRGLIAGGNRFIVAFGGGARACPGRLARLPHGEP